MKELFSNIGSVITALFSSTCCLGPAIFTGLGISAGTAGVLGGLAGFIKALIPYRPIFIILALGFLAFGFYFVYWKDRRNCMTENTEVQRKRFYQQKIWLWMTSTMVLLLILSPYLLAL